MTLGQKPASRADAAILPFVGLGFSIIVALIASSFASWFNGPLPDFTSNYLRFYPAWLVINLLSAIVAKAVKAMKLRSGEGGFWKKLDATLTAATVLNVLAGVVALVLPTLHAVRT